VTEWSVSPAQHGARLTISVGDRLVIHLHENASTGYRWVLRPCEDACVVLESTGIEVEEGVGSGGQAYWAFHADRPGSTRVELDLLRSWEGERSIQERFVIEVTVRSPSH